MLLNNGDGYTMFDGAPLLLDCAKLDNQLLIDYIVDTCGGLTYTYINHGTETEPDIEIVSITFSDGTEVDVHDNTVTYRVTTSDYNATLEGSVLLGKTPVFPESEAPVDNLTMIELVRAEPETNGGLISVDTNPRGFRLSADELDNAV